VLIVLGLGLFAMQFVGTLGEAMILFIIGAAFVAGYFYRHAYGLLIPGCILLGIALGSVGEKSLGIGEFSAIGLGIGFVAIYVIDLIYRGATHWWPLIPGLVLIATGAVQAFPNLERVFAVGWPLILVLVGLIILAGAFGLTGRKRA
jgi:hypothetical protein